MMHQRRTGALAVCHECRDNDAHDHCANLDPILSEVYRCHCSCQPRCTRPKCQPHLTPIGDPS